MLHQHISNKGWKRATGRNWPNLLRWLRRNSSIFRSSMMTQEDAVAVCCPAKLLLAFQSNRGNATD